MQSAFVDCIFCSVSIVEINYGLAYFRSGNKVTQKPNFPSRIKKFGQPFQRLWVWAMPTKAVWLLEHNGGVSPLKCESNKEKHYYRDYSVNA
jgi:hypothetical protein